MPEFSGLPRQILLSISSLSGEEYRDVEGEELRAELARRGFERSKATLVNVMHRLRNDGFVDCQFAGAMSVDLIRLDSLGRQEVEAWPVVPGQPTGNDVQALVDALLAVSEDPNVPEPERSKARIAAGAVKDLTVGVMSGVLVSWLKSIGVG